MKPVSTGTLPCTPGALTVWLCPPQRASVSNTRTRWRCDSSQAQERPEMPAPITAMFRGASADDVEEWEGRLMFRTSRCEEQTECPTLLALAPAAAPPQQPPVRRRSQTCPTP